MLRAAGHKEVWTINGGLQQSIKAGVPVTNKIPNVIPTADYYFTNWQLPIVTANDVAEALMDVSSVVIDVRDAYRYRGESEPIDSVAGHIPSAINIPFSINLDKEGNFLSSEELSSNYNHIRDKKTVIVHCGSSVTACHTLLALTEAGIHDAKLYVGSWSEWSRSGRPITTLKKE